MSPERSINLQILQPAVLDRESRSRMLAWRYALLMPSYLILVYLVVPGLFYYSELTSFSKLTFFSALFVCVWTDSIWHRIPNWITYPALAWALMLNAVGSIVAEKWVAESYAADIAPVVGPKWIGGIGIESCLLGAIACLGVCIITSAWIKIAGGDVKLAIVIGAYLGVHDGVMALCFGCMFAGLIAALICLHRIGVTRIVVWGGSWLRSRILPARFAAPLPIDDPILQSSLPLAGPLALGVMLALTPIPGLSS